MKIPDEPPRLQDLLKDSTIPLDAESKALAREYNERYLHWDDLKYRNCGACGRDKLWSLMKVLRNISVSSLDIGGLHLEYNLPNDFNRILHEMDMTMSTGLLPSVKVDERRGAAYVVSSMMEESIASSQMEGASTTAKIAKEFLRGNGAPKNRSETMIFNNYRAMQFIKTRSKDILSPELIKEVHSIISYDTLEDSEQEGCFRTDNSVAVRDAFTGDTYHEPVDSKDIDRMIRSLCDFMNDESSFVHPIVKGIILHFAIAYIHPFIDGNGRVSRSLFYWYAIKKGYAITEYLSISRIIKKHRGNYDRAFLLTETDGNDMTYFIKYNLEVIIEAIDLFSNYYQRKIMEQSEALADVRNYDLNARQKDILADMIHSGDPVTVYDMASKHQVNPQCARIDMKKLESMGLISEFGRVGHRITYIYTKQK